MTKREAVFPAGPRVLYDMNRYSAAVRSGDLLFVSGQVGSREDGSPEPDFERQVRLAFDNLAAVLEAAGCTLDDVVDVTTYHTDPDAQFETVRAVREMVIGKPPSPSAPNCSTASISRSRPSRASRQSPEPRHRNKAGPLIMELPAGYRAHRRTADY